MKAGSLREELVAGCLGLAWDQWSQLGVSGAPPLRRDERAADPEALVLFTLTIGRDDPRLFDEVLDWLAVNEPLISVHRLRNLCTNATETALVAAALEWAAVARGRRPRNTARAPELMPLFGSVPEPENVVDEVFARHGFARAPVRASGKSQSPRLREPISFAFRLRRILGVGVRAEVVRALLTVRAERLSQKVITASAAFAQRNVREGLAHLQTAGVIDAVEIADDRQYTIDHGAWTALLGFTSPPELPLHYDWIAALRALARIIRWLERSEIDELTGYLHASQARSLVEEIINDLRSAGAPVGADLALGPGFSEEFTEIARALIRRARHIDEERTVTQSARVASSRCRPAS